MSIQQDDHRAWKVGAIEVQAVTPPDTPPFAVVTVGVPGVSVGSVQVAMDARALRDLGSVALSAAMHLERVERHQQRVEVETRARAYELSKRAIEADGGEA